jgi:hypothetical protein
VCTIREQFLSPKNGCKWCEQFGNGSTSVKDEHRPGRPVEAATLNTLQRARRLMQKKRHVILHEICVELKSYHGTVRKPYFKLYVLFFLYIKIVVMLHEINVIQ